MDINTIRRLNLGVLLDEYRAEHPRAQQQEFARAIGTTPSYFSSIKGGKGKKPKRNLGDQLAREIERARGKPDGWLDHPQGWTRELVSADGQIPLDKLDPSDLALFRSIAQRILDKDAKRGDTNDNT